MNKRINVLAMIAMLLALFVCGLQSCIFTGDGLKPLTELSCQQKSIMMFDMYNQEYTSCMIVTGYVKEPLGNWEKINTPEYSDAQITLLRTKRKILVEVYPLIKIFDNYCRNGGKPNPEMETQIFALLDRIVKLIPD